ncbi:MAG TPA: asparagine synthase (glutamine-hydrolyzing) [Actinomycetota bacterium]|nr:asparagine synthase (glutamine-hydrolyzing) [Actinomycetota bacterium]
MCGVAGIVGSCPRAVAEAAIRRMTSAQAHRGPDDEGTALLEVATDDQRGVVALGSRRLAIIDVTPAGHQPMTDPATGSVLAYNGEIYNFPELRGELVAKGHEFRGRTDTEIVLVGYREWGRGVLDRLRGMFAFVLWDAQRARLLVARDHLGIKPLYYSTAGGHFSCASELGALLDGELFTPTLDRRGLAGFLAYGAVQEPLTIVEEVKALPAGSWMEIDAAGMTVDGDRYWDLPEPDESSAERLSERDLVAQGRELLATSVERHMLSDVPLGVFLSSGIDSTAVAGLARKASDHDVHAFTVSFPGEAELDESPVARRSAERLGLVFHDIPVDPSTALEWASQGLSAMDQPSMDGLNTYIVSRAVRQAGLTVALSGQGGDEIFGGYQSFQLVPRIAALMRAGRAVPAGVRSALAGAAARPGGRLRAAKARDVVAVSDVDDIYFMFRRSLADRDMARLGLDPRTSSLTRSFHVAEARRDTCPDGDPIACVSRLETRFYLGNTLLRDGDVFGMANSLEIRVPMLDRDVVDWAMRLPGPTLLPKGRPPKHLLREICADVLGPEQLDLTKRGFNLPLARWMKGPLAELRAQSLATVIDAGVVDPDGVRAIERVYLDDPYRSAWTRVWTFVALGRWLEDNPRVAIPDR